MRNYENKQIIRENFPPFFIPIVISLGFINLSLVPDSKIQLTVWILVAVGILYPKYIKRCTHIDKNDLFFLTTLILLVLPSIFNINLNSEKSITQPVYLFGYWIIYKFFKVYVKGCVYEKMLDSIVKVSSYIIFITLLLYVYSFYDAGFVRTIIVLVNNANTFDLGGITLGVGPWTPRITGFAPEPSFWSFFIVMVIAAKIDLNKIEKDKKLTDVASYGLLITALVFTFGRTGYFVFLVLIFIIILRYIKSKSILMFILLIVVSAVSALCLIGHWFIGAKFFEADESVSQRINSIDFSATTFINQPFGIGFGNFEQLALSEGKPYRDVFSFYFNLLVSGGLLALLSFLAVLLFVKKSNLLSYTHIAILAGWLVMPAYNLPYVWLFLALITELSGDISNSRSRINAHSK